MGAKQTFEVAARHMGGASVGAQDISAMKVLGKELQCQIQLGREGSARQRWRE